jgi:hypothetical protein
MFVVAPQPGEGDLWRLRRKPAAAPRMAAEGWRFLVENRKWDAHERELIARATGLAEITPNGWLHESDKWFKAFAHAYSRCRNFNQAVSDCVGIGTDQADE